MLFILLSCVKMFYETQSLGFSKLLRSPCNTSPVQTECDKHEQIWSSTLPPNMLSILSVYIRFSDSMCAHCGFLLNSAKAL